MRDKARERVIYRKGWLAMRPGILLAALVTALVVALTACGGDDNEPTVVPTIAPAPTFAPATAVPSSGNFRLTILHNNDGESQLLNLGGDHENFGGILNFADAVEYQRFLAEEEAARRGNSGHILVNTGDTFQAGAIFSASARHGRYPDAIAMDVLNYTAIVPGNHEFDFGPGVLSEFIAQFTRSRTPFLAANLDFTDEPQLRELVDQGRIRPHVIVDDLQIGIIGVITPELSELSSPGNVVVNSDLAAEVQKEVDILQSRGINRIILLSHMQDVDEEIELVGQLHGVDVVVAGGGNDLLANECDPIIPDFEDVKAAYPIEARDQSGRMVPVVTTAEGYSYLGKLVVEFDDAGHVVEIDREVSGPIRIAAGDDPVEMRELVERCRNRPEESQRVRDIDSLVLAIVLSDLEALQQVIAQSDVDLNGRRPDIRAVETNLGNLVADALLSQARGLAPFHDAPKPDVGFQNGGGVRLAALLSAGEITEMDTFSIAPFSNFVTVVEGVSRQQFKDVLENSVSTSVPGDDNEYFGGFLQIAGFTFEWTESGSPRKYDGDGMVMHPGSRVRNVVLDSGEVIVRDGVVQSGDDIVIAVPDFTARGGDRTPLDGVQITSLGLTYQKALTNYITWLVEDDGLGGIITAEDYPEGGEGRIKRLP